MCQRGCPEIWSSIISFYIVSRCRLTPLVSESMYDQRNCYELARLAEHPCMGLGLSFFVNDICGIIVACMPATGLTKLFVRALCRCVDQCLIITRVSSVKYQRHFLERCDLPAHFSAFNLSSKPFMYRR
jgi:hypothetical protein